MESSVCSGQDIICVERLQKNFKQVRAVDGASFSVKKGEIFGFLGPNGAGKSTAIRMLCTLLTPTGGTATVAGHDISRDSAEVREHIGLVSEKMIMYDRLTARENLRFFGRLYGMRGKTLENRIDELLHLVQMEKWGDTQIGKFSTGMKQRINVIRALLHTPEIVFMDEPTLGLDPASTREIRELIRRLNAENGMTIVLTTHMMNEADLLCHRIGIIDQGKLVALDTPHNLKRIIAEGETHTVRMEIRALSNELLDKMKAAPGVLSIIQESEVVMLVRMKGDDSLEGLLELVRAGGGKVDNATRQDPTLEDVFLHLTGREVRDEVSDKVSAPSGMRHGPPGMRGGGKRVR